MIGPSRHARRVNVVIKSFKCGLTRPSNAKLRTTSLSYEGGSTGERICGLLELGNDRYGVDLMTRIGRLMWLIFLH